MLRKKLESESGSVKSESGTEIADFGFLIIYEKPAIPDPGFGLPSLNYQEYKLLSKYTSLSICVQSI